MVIRLKFVFGTTVRIVTTNVIVSKISDIIVGEKMYIRMRGMVMKIKRRLGTSERINEKFVSLPMTYESVSEMC